MRALTWLVFATLLVGCVRREFTGFDGLGDDQIALVGKVQLDPPLGPGEQIAAGTLGARSVKDRLFVDVAAEVHELDSEVTPSLGNDTIEAVFDQTFRVVVGKNERFFNGGYIIMKQLPPMEVTALPLGGEAPIESGDRAVYIGTVLYHRDRFNKCVTIEIKDDYEAEAAEFAKLYGPTPKLEKRLLREVPNAPGRAKPGPDGKDPCPEK